MPGGPACGTCLHGVQRTQEAVHRSAAGARNCRTSETWRASLHCPRQQPRCRSSTGSSSCHTRMQRQAYAVLRCARKWCCPATPPRPACMHVCLARSLARSHLLCGRLLLHLLLHVICRLLQVTGGVPHARSCDGSGALLLSFERASNERPRQVARRARCAVRSLPCLTPWVVTRRAPRPACPAVEWLGRGTRELAQR
jgi:hypothetical protein